MDEKRMHDSVQTVSQSSQSKVVNTKEAEGKH